MDDGDEDERKTVSIMTLVNNMAFDVFVAIEEEVFTRPAASLILIIRSSAVLMAFDVFVAIEEEVFTRPAASLILIIRSSAVLLVEVECGVGGDVRIVNMQLLRILTCKCVDGEI